MPRFDRTGPLGQGQMTGRGSGPCGGGWGRRGYGCPYYGRVGWTKEDEVVMLKSEEKALQEELETIKKERERLEKEG